MKRGGGNFDSVASFYDRLSKLVFGNTLLEAQCHFLNTIPPNSTVLILGGGSGELLQRLLDAQPLCRVYYVDASAKMISLTQKRVGDVTNVTFIRGTENDIPAAVRVDVVITNFYLDLFSELTLQRVVEKIKSHLKPEGIWLATDFVKTSRIADKLLLKLMYIFFRVTSGIEASRLPEWEKEMRKYFMETASKYFRGEFVRSVVYSVSALFPADRHPERGFERWHA